MIDLLEVKGRFLFLRLQMWEKKAVLVDLFEWLKEDLRVKKRVLNELEVSPISPLGRL